MDITIRSVIRKIAAISGKTKSSFLNSLFSAILLKFSAISGKSAMENS
jgi:putative ribosome biogenesis GTPase RsgA